MAPLSIKFQARTVLVRAEHVVEALEAVDFLEGWGFA